MDNVTKQANRQALRSVRRDQSQAKRRLKEQKMRQAERMQYILGMQKRATHQSNALILGVVPRIQGAIDSWAEKNVPLSVETDAYSFHAFTDFTSIKIMLPRGEVNADYLGDLRGLAYHEAGHILCTVPLETMLDAVMPLEDTRGTNSATYRMLSRQRERFIEKIVAPFGYVHRAWNIMEDQRMECAMASKSPNLGRYFNTIVLTHVIKSTDYSAWPFIAQRTHVDVRVRKAARALYAAKYGADEANFVSDVIRRYKASTDIHEMWECVVVMARLMARHQLAASSIDEHGFDGYGSKPQPDMQERLDSTFSDDDAADDEAEKNEKASDSQSGSKAEDDSKDEAGPDDSAEGDGEGDDDEYDTISDPSGDGVSSKDADNAYRTLRETAKEARNTAREERNKDQALVHDERAFQDAMRDSRSSLPIARMYPGRNVRPEAQGRAASLNRAIRNLMDQARAQKAPAWQGQQRHGVLDVIRYKTRQSGDMEFFKQYADNGDLRLPDMAVSVILDGSGSMGDHNEDLAIAAYAMKSACDVVGIPCTVTVYDTMPHLLWDHNDRPLDVPAEVVPGGGTEPKETLDLIDGQMFDKDNHLVIIMTDGEWDTQWSNRLSLNVYNAPGRQIVMFYYQCTPYRQIKGVETIETHKINDLSEMPRYLNRHLTRAI